jgi:chromosome segregation ATPase
MCKTQIDAKKLEIVGLKTDRIRLNAKLKRIQAQEEKIKKRLKELEGGFRDFGEIQRAEHDLKILVRRQTDSKLPKIIWEVAPDDEWVVDKVTQKRIFARRVGGSHVEQFTHDGKSIRSYFDIVINIEETFPEGVKCMKT